MIHAIVTLYQDVEFLCLDDKYLSIITNYPFLHL